MNSNEALKNTSVNDLDEIDSLVHAKFADLLVSKAQALSEQDWTDLKHILVALSEEAAQGSSCLQLSNDQSKILNSLAGELPWFVNAQDKTANTEKAWVVLYGHYLYLNKYYQAERSIEQALDLLANNTKDIDEPAIKAQLSKLKYANELSTEIILKALKRHLAIITGGPGTGKTTIVVKLLAVLLQEFKKETGKLPTVEVLAPTGKASARVKESVLREKEAWLQELKGFDAEIINAIPETAQTIHKFLSIRPDTGKTRFEQDQKSNTDILIVDEASMIDVLLFEKLITHLKPTTRLILLGDPYQLESVEAGNVLAQIVQAGERSEINWLTESCHQLTESHRFKDDSGIGQLAQAVNNGETQRALALLNDKTLTDIDLISPEEALKEAIAGYKDYKEVIKQAVNEAQLNDELINQVFKAFEMWQVFSPFRSQSIGVKWFNREIEKALKLGEPETYYFGKPIIIKSNDSSLGLHNGDIGICLAKDGTSVSFPYINDNGELSYRHIKTRILPEHELVYAMTVHKSQGSEYDKCLLYVPEPNDKQIALLKREIFYTALTRAKKKFILAAAEPEIKTMISTKTQRMGGLFSK